MHNKLSLAYLPLEPYRARYTELMSCPDGWMDKVFKEKFSAKLLAPESSPIPLSIVTGEVLDSVARPLWAMRQIQALLEDTPDRPYQAIYLDDFYHPGLDALAYSRKSSLKEAALFSFCWAQTFDQFDFTRRNHAHWMRAWEMMAFSLYSKVFVASPLLKDFMDTVTLDNHSKVEYVGLPFNSADVREKASLSTTFEKRFDVVYSSRFDREKNPSVFLSVVKARPDLRFLICTGHSELRGTDFEAVAEAKAMAEKRNSNLTILTGLEKPDYFAALAHSDIQLNTSSQDWVSFTLLEALSFGCAPLYPRHRDFPGVFEDHPECLYKPESVPGILEGIEFHKTFDSNEAKRERFRIVEFHDGTTERIADSILREVLI